MSFKNLFKYGFWSIPEAEEFDRIAEIPYSRGSTDCDYKAVLYAVALMKAGYSASVPVLCGIRNGYREYHAVTEYWKNPKKKRYADLTGISGSHKFKNMPPDMSKIKWEVMYRLNVNSMIDFCTRYIVSQGQDPEVLDAYEFLKSHKEEGKQD